MGYEDDRRLVARILAGEAGAIEQFISEYRQFIYTILIRHLNLRREDADELFQQFLFHIWEDDYRRLRRWRGGSRLTSYLARIARNLAHDFRRNDPLEIHEVRDVVFDDQRLTDLDRRQLMERALSRLSHRDRELIRRRFYQDQSRSEIAEALRMTPDRVSVALSRAKARLKKILKRL